MKRFKYLIVMLCLAGIGAGLSIFLMKVKIPDNIINSVFHSPVYMVLVVGVVLSLIPAGYLIARKYKIGVNSSGDK